MFFNMGKKGFFQGVTEFLNAKLHKNINYIAGKDGIYEIRDSTFGRMITKVRELDLIREDFEYHLPKIPLEILEQVMAFFRAYCNEQVQYEVMVQIYWDRLSKSYFVEVPEQKVSKERIISNPDQVLIRDKRYVQVMHIHSHNTMNAFFSATDNADEVLYLLYGVVGRLQFDEPDMLLRVGCNGRFFNLPLEYVFEKVNLLPTQVTYPSEWHDKVSLVDLKIRDVRGK